jgi:hypothetical protein
MTRTDPAPIVDARETLRAALRHLESVQALQRTWAMAEAHRAVAAAYRDLGALASAAAMLETALRWAHGTGGADQVVALLCEHVELLARQSEFLERHERGSGRPARDRARDLVFEATRRATGVADPQWEVTVLLRLSDVLDRFGDRDDATTLQVRALRLTMGGDGYADPRAVAGPIGRH